MRRRSISFVALVVFALVPTAPGRAGVSVVLLEGSGWGHGVGMAQDGAYWMGRSGSDTASILGHFYPGTTPGRAGGPVRVPVATSPAGEALISFPAGGELRDAMTGPQAPGFPMPVPPGGQVLVRFDGSRYSAHAVAGDQSPGPPLQLGTAPVAPSAARHRLTTAVPDPDLEPITTTTTSPASTTTTAPPPTPTTTSPEPTTTTTTAPVGASSDPPSAGSEDAPGQPEETPVPSTTGPLWAVPKGAGTVALPAVNRRYRGVIEATGTPGTVGLRLFNDVDVEDYLRGMGEVLDPAWPPASLRAQAIAARTYALRAMASNGEICAEQQCQVYLGQQAEYPAMDEAVARTAGQVLTFGGGLASTVYSANGGGVSASREEGFGPTVAAWHAAFPYLRVAPYPTRDPAPWSVALTLDDVAARLHYPGQLSSAAVGQVGPSGRVLTVALEGSAGPRSVTGVRFAAALRLRSTLFRARVDVVDRADDGSAATPPQVPAGEPADPPSGPTPAPPPGTAPGDAAAAVSGGTGPREQPAGQRSGRGWPDGLWSGLFLAACVALWRRHSARSRLAATSTAARAGSADRRDPR